MNGLEYVKQCGENLDPVTAFKAGQREMLKDIIYANHRIV